MSEQQLDLDKIQAAVENEIMLRLTGEPCSECGRGADAEKVGSTALGNLITQLRRLRLAQQKNEAPERDAEQMNPLSLVATVKKLPADHPRRAELLELLDGHLIALQEAVRSLRASQVETPAESPLREVWQEVGQRAPLRQVEAEEA